MLPLRALVGGQRAAMGGGGGGGQKSLFVAYFLWFFLGAFGAHLFYVRRDRHCFLAFISLNFFGFGWIRDAWRLPEYVKAANNAHDWFVRQAERMRGTPSAGAASAMAQFFSASYLGLVASAAVFYIEWLCYAMGIGWHVVSVMRMNYDTERQERVQEEQLMPWCAAVMELLRHVLWAVGAAVGVLLAGTCDSTIRCTAPWRVVGVSALVKLCVAYGAPSYDGGWWVTLSAMHVFRTHTEWNRARAGADARTCACCRRAWLIGAAATVVVVLLCVHVYTTVEVDGNNGQKLKLTDAFRNFKRSKAYQEMWQFLYHCWDVGFWETLKTFADAADLDGTDAAYDALGLDRNSEVTARQLKKVRNELALAYHPDKQATAEGKAAAEIRFREIQDAYATLMKFAVKKEGGGSSSGSSDESSSSSSSRSSRSSGGNSGSSRRTTQDEDERAADAAATARATAAARARAEAGRAAEKVKAAHATSKSTAGKGKANGKGDADATRAAGKEKAKRARL